MLDGAVNIAFPGISRAFGVPVTSIQWVVITYIALFAATLLPAGRLADRVGPARVFRLGVGLSGAAFVGCGLAPGFGWLLGARILQGVGAGLVFASAPALVTLATPEARRGRALGAFNLAASLGMVLGPLVGGVLVGHWGWRVVYLGRLPLVAAAWLLARPGLPGADEVREAPREGRPSGPLVADPWTFARANLAHLLANVALFSIWLLVPYYLLEARGFHAGLGGLFFATNAIAWACATPLGGWLADRGGGRWLAPGALVAEGLGLYLVSRLDGTSSPGAIVLALALAGGGFGLFLVPNMHFVMSALPAARQGLAGSVFTLMRTVGVILGASVATWVYARRRDGHPLLLLAPALAEAAAFRDALAVASAVALAAALVSLRTSGGRPAAATPP
jgi:MFS family permease